MKSFTKPILTLSLTLFLLSCFPMKAPNVSTGMSEIDFINSTKYPERIREEEGWTVYRVRYGYHGDGVMFYYFNNNRLVKYNQGRLIPNYRVSIQTN